MHHDARARHRARLEGAARAPRPAAERGPRLGFFSGGTALRPLCAVLKRATHRTFHLVTPFDSGGSSGRLRAAFGMLSVGDLRSRLVSLADDDAPGAATFTRAFAHRLPAAAARGTLRAELEALTRGDDPLIASLEPAVHQAAIEGLCEFVRRMPPSFDLRGACAGNLILAGCYLASGRDIRAVVARFSRLARVRGLVLPVVDADLHLAATLADGSRVVGQHRMTGKEAPPLPCGIESLALVEGPDGQRPGRCAGDPAACRAIVNAELLCYPMGSFFTSVVANLLPAGVGRAVAAARCPKVYVPNLGVDPEQQGQPVHRCVDTLLRVVRADAGPVPARDILDFVLVDRQGGAYAEAIDVERIRALGVEVLDLPLVEERSRPWIDPDCLLDALLGLA